MQITYRPAGGERRSFRFRPAELRSVEAEAIEFVGGQVWDNFDDFGRLFLSGSRRAWRAALWTCLRRTDPSLAFDDLDVGVYEVLVEWDEEELARIEAAGRAKAAAEAEAESGADVDGGGQADPKASPGAPPQA